MATNYFLPWATGNGANVLADPDYAVSPEIAQGVQIGVANPKSANKAWRQASVIACLIGQIIADYAQVDASDSQPISTLEPNFRQALAAMLDGARMGVDTSTTANQITFPLTPLPVSLNKLIVWFKPINTNTGATTAQVAGGSFSALPVKRRDGAPVVAGDLVANSWYGATCDGANFTLLALTRSEILAIIAGAGGSGSGTSITLPISGFAPSNMAGTATSASMTIGPGGCADSTGAASQKQASALNWSVTNGNSANGFQGGTTLPNSSTVHMFFMWGTNGTATFASTSLSPTLPSGYSYFRRIFSFATTGAGAPITYVSNLERGGALLCKFFPALATNDINGAAVTAGRSLLPLPSIPTGIQVEVQGNGQIAGANPSTMLLFFLLSPDEQFVNPQNGYTNSAVSGQPVGAPIFDVNLGPSGYNAGTEIQDHRRITDLQARLAFDCGGSIAGCGLYYTPRAFVDFRAA